MHAALLTAQAADRVEGLARLEDGHHGTLARNDPEKNIRAHGGGRHGAHQQERGALTSSTNAPTSASPFLCWPTSRHTA